MTSQPAGAADPSGETPLVTRTTLLPVDAALSLLSLLPDLPSGELLSWVRRGEGLVGWGRATGHTAYGPGRFAELDAWWAARSASAVVRDDVHQPGTGPVAFGSLSYAADSAAGATLVVPQVLVGRRGDQVWVTTATTGHAVPPTLALGAAAGARTPPHPPVDVVFGDGVRSPTQWAGVVSQAVTLITSGRLDKVVLARDLDVRTTGPIDARSLLLRLASQYQNTWVFAVDGLVGASPEMLVRVEKGLVISRVLAGTIRRTGDDEHDLALAGSLARSSKDLEEHEYAVRSVADALAPHCSSMNVPESPFVLHLPNVMHLATDVTGVLSDWTTSLALAESLHPSAAVCGTPAVVADAVITELEGMDRGRYAGPVGWIDSSGDGEWAIALRCGQIDSEDPSRMRLFAGCGIVAGSDPQDELAESDAKLVPMRDALTGWRSDSLS